MTNIKFFRDYKGNIVKFEITGHTNFAENGSDIVCAAVSAVSFACLNGIEKVIGLTFGYETDDGYMLFVLPDDIDCDVRQKVNILLDTLYLFVLDLKKQYNDNIGVEDLEV